MNRCAWVSADQLYIDYHDHEWGKPTHDDKVHYEFLILESAQAGLSWITVLRKRENYRKAFDEFDVNKVAAYDENKIMELLDNPGIIRNRKKIEAAINNANCFIKVQEEFGSFDSYIWEFVDNKPVVGHWTTFAEVPTSSELSDRISKDLKARGFKFLGTTIIYSFLQALGIVNDHTVDCFLYDTTAPCNVKG